MIRKKIRKKWLDKNSKFAGTKNQPSTNIQLLSLRKSEQDIWVFETANFANLGY